MHRLLFSLAMLASPAAAQVAPPPVTPTILDPAALARAELDTVLAFTTTEQRMTVPVRVDVRGPWPFVVDTGAERSVISRQLATVLRLPPGPSVRVMSMTGTDRVDTVRVPSLGVSTISTAPIIAPALEARDMGAAGLVGIDALQGHSVVIEFERSRMSLRPSKRRGLSSARGDVVVAARSLYGQLIVTDARWRGKRIAVVIDTGTPMSLGNPALGRLMTSARPIGTVDLVSVTGGRLTAAGVAVDGLEVGGIGFDNVTMAVADAPPFHRFGLGDSPALLMGMDMLRLFRTVQIDFANRQIRFSLPRGMRSGRPGTTPPGPFGL